MQALPIPPRVLFPNPAENLTGYVLGKRASDLEERTFRSLARIPEWNFRFRVRLNPITRRITEVFTNLRGELEIDFLVWRGSIMFPLLIDGEIGHYLAAWQRAVDEQATAEINDLMRAYGALPAVRVEYWRLANQDLSNAYYRELLR